MVKENPLEPINFEKLPELIKTFLSENLMEESNFNWVGGRLIQLKGTNFYYSIGNDYWVYGKGSDFSEHMCRYYFQLFYDNISLKEIFIGSPKEVQSNLVFYLDEKF